MKEKICWIKVSLKIVSLCRGIVDSMKYGLDTKRKRQTDRSAKKFESQGTSQ